MSNMCMSNPSMLRCMLAMFNAEMQSGDVVCMAVVTIPYDTDLVAWMAAFLEVSVRQTEQKLILPKGPRTRIPGF